MLYSQAVNKLLPDGVNHNNGGNVPRILVVHIMVGYMQTTDQIFNDTSRQASAHFGVSRHGEVWQWVDTDDRAWHAYAANSYSIGVEHAGYPQDGLSASQINATGRLYAWANTQYPALSLWLNRRIVGSGLGYHRQYPEWNLDSHTCPGDLAIGQLHDILDVANAVR